MDLRPDEELVAAGLAREVVNRVQRLRKKAGLQAMDAGKWGRPAAGPPAGPAAGLAGPPCSWWRARLQGGALSAESPRWQACQHGQRIQALPPQPWLHASQAAPLPLAATRSRRVH